VRYEEAYPKRIISVAILIIVFLILYSPWHLGLRELLTGEGKYAAIALDMNLLNPSTTAHGETLSFYYPLYPWFVAISYKLGFGLEVGLRGVSVLALGILGIVVFETGRRIAGIQEAVVGAAFMIANIYVFQKAIDGNPFTLAVLLLYLGWFTWYMFGLIKGDWNTAWIVGFFFCGLAFYTIGWLGILYFIIPLIFMRRPLTIWNKLHVPGFAAGVVILSFFILLWFIPRSMSVINNPFNSFNIFQDISPGYFSEVALFPFALIGGFMPWSFIAWPSFCVAYFPLHKNPIFNRFLRTIFLSLLIILWFNPFTQTRDMIILIPPLAIMTGVNYWIIIRRHGNILHAILRYITIVVLIMAILSFSLFLVPTSWWYSVGILEWIHSTFLTSGFSFLRTMYAWGIIQTGLAIIVGIYLLVTYKKHLTIWLHSLGICVIFMLCFWALTYPYRSLTHDAEVAADSIIKSLGKNYHHDMTIYKGSEIYNIYVLGCYLGTKMSSVSNLKKSNSKIETVYLLSLTVPVRPKRLWSQVTVINYKGKTLHLWKGKLIRHKMILGI